MLISPRDLNFDNQIVVFKPYLDLLALSTTQMGVKYVECNFLLSNSGCEV